MSPVAHSDRVHQEYCKLRNAQTCKEIKYHADAAEKQMLGERRGHMHLNDS